MKVSILQYSITWRDAQANLDYIGKKIANEISDSDLFILPEMFTTGVSTDVVGIAESMQGLTLTTLKKWAALYDIAICGSILIKEGEKYYNRFVFVEPEGEVNIYDKRHCFTMGGEHEVITAGQECNIIKYKGWRIKPQICYDLRFPVWSRNTEKYDLLIYVSNWPKARDLAYDTLLHARALENQCYVCACNRTGVDGSKITYKGNSLIIDAMGQNIAKAENNEIVITHELSKADLEKFRVRFPVLEDGDDFDLK